MSDEDKNDPFSADEAPEEVGYGKPPKKHRFGKGTSGNPAGRPKDAKREAISILAFLDGPMVIVEGGKRKIVTKQEAFEAHLFQRALTGKASDVKCFLDYLKMRDVPAARAKEIAQHAAPTKMIVEWVQGPSEPKPIVRT